MDIQISRSFATSLCTFKLVVTPLPTITYIVLLGMCLYDPSSFYPSLELCLIVDQWNYFYQSFLVIPCIHHNNYQFSITNFLYMLLINHQTFQSIEPCWPTTILNTFSFNPNDHKKLLASISTSTTQRLSYGQYLHQSLDNVE